MVWEAFEQAGSSMRGGRCGVYVGLSSVDYAYRRADDLGAIDATTMTGSASSIAEIGCRTCSICTGRA
jgi:acyl transferase domain-containing protein